MEKDPNLWAIIVGPVWDFVKWILLLIVGILTWIWKRQDSRIDGLAEKIGNHVTKDDMNEKVAEVEARVQREHESIISEIHRSNEQTQMRQDLANEQMRKDLKDCNSQVMGQVSQIREFIFNHLERRGKDKE